MNDVPVPYAVIIIIGFILVMLTACWLYILARKKRDNDPWKNNKG